MVLIIGSYSKSINPGIYLYRFRDDKNQFELLSEINGIEDPSYLTISKEAGFIYAISEDRKGDQGRLHIYQVEPSGLKANLIDVVSFKAAGSCHICTDLNQTHAFIANYRSGSVTVFKLPKNGNSASVAQQITFNGNGPNLERQERSHLHATMLSKDGSQLYCSDLGSDRIYRFMYNPKAEQPLIAEKPLFLNLPAGSGPRHFAFSNNGKWLYIITELGGETFVFNTSKPTNRWTQSIRLVQTDFQGKPEAADIHMHPNGKTLYASLRGEHNEILVFAINPLGGHLSLLQRIGSQGEIPKCLLVCNQQKLLLVANEKGNRVSIFNILANGKLDFGGKQIKVATPTCVKVFPS